MQCCESLQTKNRADRVAIFRTILNSAVGSLAERMVNDVMAGGDYQQQQEAQTNGKFFDVVLDDALCVECGIATLGLPELDIVMRGLQKVYAVFSGT